MHVDIRQKEGKAEAYVHLFRGERLIAEHASAYAPSRGISQKRLFPESTLSLSFKHAFMGESFLQKEFACEEEKEAQVTITHKRFGGMHASNISGGLFLRSKALFAYSSDLEVRRSWRMRKRELQCQTHPFHTSVKGKGIVVLCSNGDISEILVEGDEDFPAASVLGFDSSLQMSFKDNGEETFFTFHGQGRVYCESLKPGTPSFTKKLADFSCCLS